MLWRCRQEPRPQTAHIYFCQIHHLTSAICPLFPSKDTNRDTRTTRTRTTRLLVLEGGAAAGQLATDMAAAGGETMMTREQLLHLFSRFSFVTSLPGRSPSPPRFRFAPHPPPIRFPLIFVPCPAFQRSSSGLPTPSGTSRCEARATRPPFQRSLSLLGDGARRVAVLEMLGFLPGHIFVGLAWRFNYTVRLPWFT